MKNLTFKVPEEFGVDRLYLFHFVPRQHRDELDQFFHYLYESAGADSMMEGYWKWDKVKNTSWMKKNVKQN